MKAVYGFNKDLIGGVHSLFDEHREAVIFPASHTLVYYDCYNKKQTFLQGHTSEITAVAVSNDKHWVVSGDAGDDDTMIIVWDSQNLKPVRTYRLPQSVLRIDLSDDGALIGVLTDVDQKDGMQYLKIFEWAVASEDPIVENSIDVKEHGFQRDVRFNPSDFRELVTNSPFKTLFWNWTEQQLANNQKL